MLSDLIFVSCEGSSKIPPQPTRKILDNFTFDKDTSYEALHDDFTEFLEFVIDLGFFKIPASSKYHGSYDSGLFNHSFNVTSKALSLLSNLFSFSRFSTVNKSSFINFDKGQAPSDFEVICAAFFHDINKLGCFYNDEFIPKYKKCKDAWEYFYIFTQLPRDLTDDYIHIIEEFEKKNNKIIFNDVVKKAISIHDGLYIPKNKEYVHKEGLLSLIVHYADYLSTWLTGV